MPQLERALGNLMSTAIKYSLHGAERVIEVGRERKARATAAEEVDTAVLCIHDQGVGSPQADLATIFEPFHRAVNVAERLPGLGIALTTARQIIVQHGGAIWVASEFGRGTSVTIDLPLLPAEGVYDADHTTVHKWNLRCDQLLAQPVRQAIWCGRGAGSDDILVGALTTDRRLT